jgi:hypothetical protein
MADSEGHPIIRAAMLVKLHWDLPNRAVRAPLIDLEVQRSAADYGRMSKLRLANKKTVNMPLVTTNSSRVQQEAADGETLVLAAWPLPGVKQPAPKGQQPAAYHNQTLLFLITPRVVFLPHEEVNP